MKRTAITLLAFALFMTGASAQVTEQVSWRSFTQPRDSLKVDSLYTFWNTYVQLHPKDENAWRNLFEVEQAKEYHQRFWKKGDRQTAEELRKQLNVVGRMKQAIPGTYTYYYCAYVSSDARSKADADSAVSLLPKDAPAEDYELWASCLNDRKDSLLLAKVLTLYYESGQYPASALQYDYNELQGMEKGGVYLGYSKGNIMGKLILQYALGVHKDKILCYQGTSKEYVKEMFESIGIPFSDEIYKQLRSSLMKDGTAIMRYIFEHSKRPVYLSASNRLLFGMPDDLKACLYNEGLTMRYSAKPYNNGAVKRRNVEQRYLMDYLVLQFHPEVKSFEPAKSALLLSYNYLILLHDLMPYYKKHNMEQYARLNRVFTGIMKAISNIVLQGDPDSDKYYSILYSEDGGPHYEFVERTRYESDPNDDEATFKRKYDEFLKKNTRVLIKTEPIE